MPRVADHEQRRAQIARAFEQLLATRGFAGVSFTRVAAEAGISVGLIQHYFTSKDALLRFVYADAVHRMSRRLRARSHDCGDSRRPIADTLLDTLVELLPLDAERDAEYRIRQNLQTQALHDPGLAEVARRAGRDLLTHVAATIEDGKRGGEVDPGLDAEPAARIVLAKVQGLADQLVLSGTTAFPARELLRQGIAAALNGHYRVPHD